MSTRPRLHATARRLAVWVLAWFALSLGVAVASPVVQPRALELVCTAGAMKLLVHGDADGGVLLAASGHGMDCALCFSAGAPPAAPAASAVLPPHPLAHVLQPAAAAHIAWLTAAPLPARGPPAVF